MKISVITPVYNDPRVGRALSSALAQRMDHELETIVIDAGSKDGTLEVLERYGSQIDVLVSEPDNGIYDGMNKGIERATGDLIGILNADDRYADELVLRDVAEVFRDEDIEVCYGNVIYENADGRMVRYWRSGRASGLKWRLGWMPPHPGFFVRREVYQQLGVFNQQLRIAADYELMLRLLFRHQLRSAHIDRVLVRMTLGGMSNRSVASVLRAALEVRAAWKLNSLPYGQFAPVLKPAGKLDQYFRRPIETTEGTTLKRGKTA